MLIRMTPTQSRAACALLDMTQSELARLAGLGLSTVVDFEKNRRLVSKDAVEAVRRAFEELGIEFLRDLNGEGVRRRSNQT